MSVVTTEQSGLVSIIRINRPEKLNAISGAVAVELQQAFEAFDASDQRVAILSAAGERAFTSGADVTDLPELWRAIPKWDSRRTNRSSPPPPAGASAAASSW